VMSTGNGILWGYFLKYHKTTESSQTMQENH
jgi:hypothetical protein